MSRKKFILLKELKTITPLTKTIALIIFLALPVLAFLYGKNYSSLQNEVPATHLENSTNDGTNSITTPVAASFMREGEIWFKDFASNKEFKVSQSSKVITPILSNKGNKVAYFDIVHVGGGFPTYGLYYSNVSNPDEKRISESSNIYASNILWSKDERYLGNILFEKSINTPEVYIFDTIENKKIYVGSFEDPTQNANSNTDSMILNCGNLSQVPDLVDFCKQYVQYIEKPRQENRSYKREFYKNSMYTKPRYTLSHSEKLQNGLIKLEYFTGEPQNSEAQGGIGGGTFIPGYDKGVTSTYTLLVDENKNEVVVAIEKAINTDFIF